GDENAVHRIQNGIEIHLVAKTWHQKRRYTCDVDGGCQILLGCCVPGVVFKWLYIGRYGNERARSLGHNVRIHQSDYALICSVPYFSAMGRTITNRCRLSA